jgi:hypothetical protein
MAGDDVVLAFVTPPQQLLSGEIPPIKQLFGFRRVHLNVNETTAIFFPINVGSLLSIARDGSKWLHAGLYHIMIGQGRKSGSRIQQDPIGSNRIQ